MLGELRPRSRMYFVPGPKQRRCRLKKPYAPPRIEEWTIAELTQVGQTNPGGDTLPAQSKGKESGSVYPGGLS